MRLFSKLLLASVATISATTARADVVMDWADYALLLERDAARGPQEGLTNSQLAVAMFEAANAVDRRYQSFLGMAPASSGASSDAALIAAARDVLIAHYPAKKDRIEENAAFALTALSVTPEAREAGVRVGNAAAKLALARGGVDAAVTQMPYRPHTKPGTWVGASLPVFDPYFQAMKPWVIGRVDAVRPPPPPALTSERYARDFDEVKRMGAKDSTDRTPHQSLMARYRITPALMPMLHKIADQPGRSTVANARLLARLWIADYDEGLAMADAKMHYNFWRPITAIRNAADDANDKTVADAGWLPMIATPNHPEYPCGHCGYSAVAAEILKAEVGNAPPGGVVVASRSIDDAVVMRLPTFDEWVKQVSFSRTLGGVHYRFSNEAGEQIGRDVAAKVLTIMPPLRR